VQWVGDHIRPRVRVPDSWHWPVGVSLSTEIGYQRAVYSPDTWTWEIRPIVDKTLGRWYFAFNPALERTWHGPDVNQGLGFSPGAKIGYDFTKVVSGGFEYYADYGRITDFDTLHNQQQQIFAVTDLNVSPKWEINIGVGVGPTAATDHLIVKGILGRRFDWGHCKDRDERLSLLAGLFGVPTLHRGVGSYFAADHIIDNGHAPACPDDIALSDRSRTYPDVFCAWVLSHSDGTAASGKIDWHSDGW
jgi:hypothetical protein